MVDETFSLLHLSLVVCKTRTINLSFPNFSFAGKLFKTQMMSYVALPNKKQIKVEVQKLLRKCGLCKSFLGRILKSKQNGCYLVLERNIVSQALEVGVSMVGIRQGRTRSATQ